MDMMKEKLIAAGGKEKDGKIYVKAIWSIVFDVILERVYPRGKFFITRVSVGWCGSSCSLGKKSTRRMIKALSEAYYDVSDNKWCGLDGFEFLADNTRSLENIRELARLSKLGLRRV